MSRIACVGVGAIGGALAAPLVAMGEHEVVLCVREPFARLVVESPTRSFDLEVRCETDPVRVGPVDWLLLATKAQDVPGAAKWLAELARPGTVVAVLQNGVEQRERVTPFAGSAEVLPVVVELPARRSAPGRIRMRGGARLSVPEGPSGHAFAALFAGSDVLVEETADFTTSAWRKLCLNAASGALLAATSRPIEVLHEPGMAELARGIMRECLAVGRAEGARVPDAIADAILTRLLALPAGSGNSMLYDRLAGKPLELDARNGVIVRKGRQHGVATPLNAALCALLAAQEGR
ncbi:MAG TPA: 2-dehydropantoate 2-reductase [Myxococcota bacterium]|nr:2-dehydropantoate 2-reductase [Myxococcota bacterium]